MVQWHNTVKNGPERSRISEDSGTSSESCQSKRSKGDISDSEEEPSSPRSTSSQDSDTSNESCQSKTSKNDIVTFEEEPSSPSLSAHHHGSRQLADDVCVTEENQQALPLDTAGSANKRRDQDSATASASRQSDSSKGDNIHGQEEPSSVRSTIKRHSGSSIESCQSKRSKGDTLLSIPPQRFLSLSAQHHDSRQLADNVCVTEENQQALPLDTAGSANKRRDQDSGTASASRPSGSSNGDNILGQEVRYFVSSYRSRLEQDLFHLQQSLIFGLGYPLLREPWTMSSGSDDLLTDFMTPIPPVHSFGLGYPLLRESRTMSSWPHGHLTDFMTPSPPPDLLEESCLFSETWTMSSGSDDHLTDFGDSFLSESTISQDSDTSNVSCQSKRSKDHIIDFKAPSSRRSTSSQDSDTSNESCQSRRSKYAIIDFKAPSSRRSTSGQDSDTSTVSCQSKRSKYDIIDFKAPSSRRSTSSQDSDTSSLSCQSKTSKYDIIDFKEEPSSPR